MLRVSFYGALGCPTCTCFVLNPSVINELEDEDMIGRPSTVVILAMGVGPSLFASTLR